MSTLTDLNKAQNLMLKRSKKVLQRERRVFGYVRTSKTETHQKYSAGYQEEEVKKLYQRLSAPGGALHGIPYEGTFIDRVSGSTPFVDRTAGRVIINRLLPGDVVLAYNMDRMTRSMFDGASMMQLFFNFQITLITCDGDNDLSDLDGRMIAMLKIGFAEKERARIIERIKAALAHRRLVKRKQQVAFNAPPGWRRQRVFGEWMQVPCKAARETAAKIVLLRDQEALPWEEIGRRLRRRHIWHGVTKEWDHNTVRDWYKAAKEGFPNNNPRRREKMPPLMIEVPDPQPAISETTLESSLRDSPASGQPIKALGCPPVES